jgi:peptide/nickel transport system ATP-binding protein
MHHGELVEQGPVETVRANLQHDYTQRLLADVPHLHGWGAVINPEPAMRR